MEKRERDDDIVYGDGGVDAAEDGELARPEDDFRTRSDLPLLEGLPNEQLETFPWLCVLLAKLAMKSEKNRKGGTY